VAPTDPTTELFERYGEELYRYCLRRLESPEEAEDALQNTFVRVHRALRRGVRPEYESAWLYRIAHNVCASRLELATRRARWASRRPLEDVDVAAPEHDPDAALGLVSAVAELPENLREALLLREWHGLSYAEIADSMGTTVPAVETLLVRARRHLTSVLKPFRRARLVDATLLFSRMRGLAETSGPLRAVGAAVVAASGVVVAAGTVGADAHRTAAPPQVVAATMPRYAAGVTRPAPRRPLVSTQLRRSSASPAAVLHVHRSARRRPGAIEPPAAVVRSAAPPAGAAPARAPAAEPAAAPTPAPTSAPQPVQTTGAVTPPEPPVVDVSLGSTTPVVTVPAATAPVATTPAVTTPVVTTPAVTTPVVTTPTITVPPVSLP
jgi:RNA polymerase sigma-70 factor (ECF subfamily)